MLFAVIKFYHDGFRSMQLGRTLWKIILVKLLVLLAVLRVFFFSETLQSRFDNDQDRAEHVLLSLTMGGNTAPSDSWSDAEPRNLNPRTEVLHD
jgi:hypothetical protein